jgi:hypothetical protein
MVDGKFCLKLFNFVELSFVTWRRHFVEDLLQELVAFSN